MFVYQIGSSINVMMEGGMPAPLDKEADAVFGLDNFVYPGSDGSFAPFGEPTAIVERLEGTVKQSADYEMVQLTYDKNGGTGDDMAPSKGKLGATVEVKACTYTAPDTKSFSKWNTAADGSGTDYAAEADFVLGETNKLYAIWA